MIRNTHLVVDISNKLLLLLVQVSSMHKPSPETDSVGTPERGIVSFTLMDLTTTAYLNGCVGPHNEQLAQDKIKNNVAFLRNLYETA